ncbi:MAG TPA: TSUP family transporter [Verrucomicrobiota bacterium]|nr:TSUP family transporter [Verrucomicrobiota bacterium]
MPAVQDLLGLAFGLIVGVALGLTGGGGSIFAVPLLAFGLGLPLTSAVGISLAAVGATAGFGAARHWRDGELELRSGLVFAAGGMALAPLGAWLGGRLPPELLLAGFAVLMAYLAWRMWRGRAEDEVEPGPCVARPDGRLGPGCYSRLSAAGGAAGVLSGLFGVGGGFIIVQGLLYVTGMALHRAVATSLLVIFLISLSGVAAHVAHGLTLPLPLTLLFVAGGVGGMLLGQHWRARLSGPSLRRVFAVAMWTVAALMLAKSVSPAGEGRTPPPPAWEESAIRERGGLAVSQGFSLLSGELARALAAGGVSNALAVCSEKALPLTAAVGATNGVRLRRVALRHRNPANAPEPAERAVLEEFAAKIAAGKSVMPLIAAHADGTATYFAPIVLNNPLCLRCHGAPGKELAEADAGLIRRLYPDDRATGFALGDLRGMWRVDFPVTVAATSGR